MQQYFYLAFLLMTICSLLTIDRRWRLAFFAHWRRTAKTIAVSMMVFIVWDAAGIAADIFYPGDSKYVLDILLAPGFPVEEVFFLFVLVYVTLIIWRGWEHYADVSRT
jgi:lycopene cyclase domain-containing protein